MKKIAKKATKSKQRKQANKDLATVEVAGYVEAAKRLYNDAGHIEVDDNAVVSHGQGSGAYVQAWVWVADPQGDV